MPHKRSRRPFAFRPVAFCLLWLLAPAVAFGQGKIAGRVTDAATGEPLVGVNVLIDGTTQGTVTDADGNYILLNVRPGEYTLVFSYIGFQTHRVEGLRVVTGQTTSYDVQLREEVIQGQEVVVTAERPLIQKDLTASKKTVVAEEIEALPVEGFFGVLVTQAGVNQGPGGEIHIRGGRSNEVAYLVDGLSVGNPFDTNGLATTVAADAIQEMTVISGAFNAEYGKAMSGIVNLVTKEGGDRYTGSVSFYGGDNVTAHGDLFYTPPGYRLNVYTFEGTLSGPVPFYRPLRFFVSYRRDVDDGHIYGFREHLPSDSANFNAGPGLLETIRQHIPDYDGPAWYYEIRGTPWYELDDPAAARGERVAMNPSSSANFIGKLSLRPFAGAKIEYAFLHDRSRRKPFDFAYRFNPDGVVTNRDWSYNHSLHWTHTLNDRTFYTLRLSYATNTFRQYLYEDPLDPRYVSTGKIQGFPGNNFVFGGNQKSHVYEDARSFRAKLDFTRQFGTIHEAKTGIEFQRHSLDRENFVILFDGDRYPEPTIPPLDSPSHDKYEGQQVTELSAYVQDKLEFDDFIINAGLRYEYFNPHGYYIPNLLDPKGNAQPPQRAEVKHLFLPRLGVSFPITDTGIIHFSYGHFAQMPALRQMYVNPEFEFPVGTTPTFGNPNMRPERTVQYELGLQQQLTDDVAFDVTGFFKDIRDYLALQTIRYSTIAGEDVYNIYLNRDYANIKGITFALTKRRGRGGLVAATLDYTFQIAEGNRNDANAFFFNFLSGRETELELIPLDFDQRHIVSGTVTLTRPRNWGLSLIGQFATGYPYTPLLIDQKLDQLPNSDRKPSQIKLDLHAYKDFALGERFSFRIFAKVFNVLDRMNERFVFDDTGRATYSLNGERGVHASWEPAYGLPGIHTLDEYNTRPHYFSAPREVRLGATLSF
ncbi:TonB-dependent receptor [Rhodocaloribacter litoris]|uniref:TonB-dependent receptor n=1 Tax=Rhodocaloribacter litoris TaxID=2558931 RepID=UPI0014209F00|nr:TonB-dependent receptor [Rhodocaloribacter litoris]QXD15618.1 TonB-dependent receptor [Rhodocaloribacter litoris]